MYVLEKFLRDKIIIERIIKLTKGQNTEHMNIIHKRHRVALAQDFKLKNVSENVYLLNNSFNEEAKGKKVSVIKTTSKFVAS